MHVHVLQHVPFEGLGSIEAWLARANARVTWTRLFESADFPDANTVDLLIVLGGPMSVNDGDKYPWLAPEKQFLVRATAGGTAVLGICLGAQLIASALEARVYPCEHKEIGWFPVRAEVGGPGCFVFPDCVEAFHWHGESLDLPVGAGRLASSAACPNQAFQFGRRVIGLQCHLEITPGSVDALMDNCAHELMPQRYVQSESELRSVPANNYAAVNAVMARVLAYLVAGM